MSERRIHLVTDDGTTIDVTLRPGVTKVTLEVTERPASGADSVAGNANLEPVSPESPGSTTGIPAPAVIPALPTDNFASKKTAEPVRARMLGERDG